MDKLKIKADFTKYIDVFLQKNAKLNLISKNDEKLLFEKHIYDSLGIKLFFEKYKTSENIILPPEIFLILAAEVDFPAFLLQSNTLNLMLLELTAKEKKLTQSMK